MAHMVDIHVGKRIRHRRWQLGLTQENLAAVSGVKYQQIQKYETGANRISASRLWEISSALGVSIRYLYEGLEEQDTAGLNPELFDFLHGKEAADLISTYRRIPEAHRKKLYNLAKVLAA